MHTKSFAAHVKADQTSDSGEFEAIVSVFGNVDSYGDIVEPGAFAESLSAWKSSGNPIPVIWSHQWGDPDSHIGEVLDAAELLPGDAKLPEAIKANGGLWIKGRVDMGEPRAAKVHRLLKGRRVTQFSFAYDINDAAQETVEGVSAYHLRKLHVLEVGPTLIGANRATDLVSAKAGKVLSAKNVEQLVAARDAIDGVLASAAADEPAKASAPAVAPPDADAKSDEGQSTEPRLDPFAVLTITTLVQEDIQ